MTKTSKDDSVDDGEAVLAVQIRSKGLSKLLTSPRALGVIVSVLAPLVGAVGYSTVKAHSTSSAVARTDDKAETAAQKAETLRRKVDGQANTIRVQAIENRTLRSFCLDVAKKAMTPAQFKRLKIPPPTPIPAPVPDAGPAKTRGGEVPDGGAP